MEKTKKTNPIKQLALALAVGVTLRFALTKLGWRLYFVVAVGAIVQAGFVLLAVWARRHLGGNWSAGVKPCQWPASQRWREHVPTENLLWPSTALAAPM